MNKVYNYLNNKFIYYNERKSELLSELHKLQINIDHIDSTIEKISSGIDTSKYVFSGENAKQFETEEIGALRSDKETLIQKMVSLQNEIEENEKEVEELSEVLKNYQESEEINSHGIVVVESQERERQRIARDIHDSVVQTMTGLVHKSEFCMKVMDIDPLRAKLELEVINSMVRNCIDEMRAIIYDLRPMSFDDLGIDVTLNRVIERCKMNTDMKIRYITEGVVRQLKPVVALSLIRIIQEACNNSIKYSEGKEIVIRLIYNDDNVTLVHEDDGKGFEFDKASNITENNTGFGLSSLKERVYLLGGKILFGHNENGVGTQIKVVIPMIN